jgi:hypothetical protein
VRGNAVLTTAARGAQNPCFCGSVNIAEIALV